MAGLSAEQVKQFALEAGADLVGIGSMDRFEGAPKWLDPRYIFPEARCIIGLAFRIPRCYLRGIEEGTHFYQYPALGYANINEVYAPIVLRELSCFLEDHGYEAVPIRNMGGNAPVSDMTGDPEEPAEYGRRRPYSRPVREGWPAPDVFLHFRIAAFICGLGEIGWSKVFLTPDFGPLQRFAFLLTDAPLEPDPLYDGPSLCDRCMACVEECPVDAISRDEAVRVQVAGRTLEWGRLDEWQCFWGYVSGVANANPFLPPDAFCDMPCGEWILAGTARLSPPEVLEVQRRAVRYYPHAAGYLPATCGGRGCLRACYVHLERRGILRRRFKAPFRRRRPWWH